MIAAEPCLPNRKNSARPSKVLIIFDRVVLFITSPCTDKTLNNAFTKLIAHKLKKINGNRRDKRQFQ